MGGDITDLAAVASRIKTYTEGASNEYAEKIKDEIEKADVIFVLGFGAMIRIFGFCPLKAVQSGLVRYS